jgi:hypothetical protein
MVVFGELCQSVEYVDPREKDFLRTRIVNRLIPHILVLDKYNDSDQEKVRIQKPFGFSLKVICKRK